MLLSELIAQLPGKPGAGLNGDREITGIEYDPLRIKPGNLFVPINIYTQLDKVELPDGHLFIEQAVGRGAAAVIHDKNVTLPEGVPGIRVTNSREALSRLAAHFFGYPNRSLKLLGVTGTNGKTTTTHILEAIFSESHTFSLTGTLYYKINGVVHGSKDTTPEPTDLHQIFLEMKEAGSEYCAMEVSSHGIDMHRVDGLDFRVGIFTNLSPDHLDYHKTMTHYRDTKLRFFEMLAEQERWGIVNSDDPVGEMFARAAGKNVLTFGMGTEAAVRASNLQMNINQCRYDVETPWGNFPIDSRLIGSYNIYNTLGAIAAALTCGISIEEVRRGAEKAIRVPGRFEFLDAGQDFAVVVDFAHTPDSMENVLKLARSLTQERVITLFGCGGDRDPIKRPQMGRVAEHYSDLIIMTADNPRNESLDRIMGHIRQGLLGIVPTVEIADRAEAVAHAIGEARPGDLVLLLGKGHETSQTIGNQSLPYNDRQCALSCLGRVDN